MLNERGVVWLLWQRAMLRGNSVDKGILRLFDAVAIPCLILPLHETRLMYVANQWETLPLTLTLTLECLSPRPLPFTPSLSLSYATPTH